MASKAPASTPNEYVLGTDEAEYARLGFQHQLWSDLAHRTWRAAGLGPGQRVLDLGSGPGYAAFDLAAFVGQSGRVIAVDESRIFVERLGQAARERGLATIEAHSCSAESLDEIGIENASIDVIYSRWVFCFLADPEAAVRHCARLLKPGGRLCVNDYFNYRSMTIAPRSEAFCAGIAAIAQSWVDRGGDSDIVGRLPGLCLDAGLEIQALEVDQRLARPGETMWHWADTFWPNFVPRLVASGHLTQDQADAFFDAWRTAERNPGGFMALPPVYQFIARKPG